MQLEQSQAKLHPQSDNLSASPASSDPAQIVVPETPCFKLSEFAWQDADAFPWLAAKSKYFVGQCLGARSLKRLRDYLTLALLEKGYVTSRVVYPAQNLNQGKLTLQVIPGRLGKISHKNDAIGITVFPLATHSGALLNQRDLDQSLENFRRLPSEAATRFELIPGAALGESDLLITHGQASRWQGNVGLDDAGSSSSTGKHQLSANLSVDSLLRMYDSLTLTYNRNANYQNQTLGNHATGLQWSVPVGYASAFVGASLSDYKQTVAGFVAPIEYSGNSRTLEAGAGFTAYRTGNYKGLSQLKFFRKSSRNFIDQVEIGVQARDVLGWEISHQHKHFLGPWTINLGATVRASSPAHSKNTGVIVGEPDWNGYYRLSILSLFAGRSFSTLNRPARFQSQLRWQRADTPTPPSEYVSIGGRYTVRGFDGETALSAESGGYWRNELELGLFDRQQAYLALDIGRIAGKQSEGLSKKTLAGIALGLRGSLWQFGYDMSIGWPLLKPYGFTSHPAFAGAINFEFNG